MGRVELECGKKAKEEELDCCYSNLGDPGVAIIHC